ncbi:TRAP transporter substrate-binding protein [Pseudooceanicola sp. CBS1P-1]|uniref:DctP family TRAP transporter solute-binding subunit n=1 Tax=Pseudooceanicola albus TaxID=2692189 RepID=A0A6L7G8C5_9RHOB|nr:MULTISPECIES: TRAP transporter substrate-binding protein [Pseudooceanicola]MBT9385913.1 TRAP transporter substrate-binding protein [Pseudooceanicola endophyticus]MXN19666.1 DctP family TRAP transporter solute-binding subunit [Pseudooceanicola albus]
MNRMITALAALGLMAGAAQAETLRFAYASNATATKEAMAKFGELVKEKSGGDVTVQFFPDSQLGGERELVEMVQGGMLDMTKVSGGLMESFAPVYGVFSMPYLFDSEAHFYAAMDDADIMEPIYQATAKQGMVGLTYYNSGARSFYTSKVPIKSVADLKGLKIRVMQSPTSIEMVKELGASPIAMGQGEVYTSIQQGVLDGAENNEYALTVARHGEVAKYYSYDMHSRIPDIVLISTATLNKLSEKDRAAVIAAAKESTEYQKQLWDTAIEAEKKKAQDEFGVQFFYPDVAEFQKAVQPMYEALKAEPAKYAVYEKIRALAGE